LNAGKMAHHQAKLEVFYDGCPYNLFYDGCLYNLLLGWYVSL
jgi:hypothetical protein